MLMDGKQKLVDTLQSDPRTSEEEHFKLVLLQMEVERVKFLVRSYVRTRLSKVGHSAISSLWLSKGDCATYKS